MKLFKKHEQDADVRYEGNALLRMLSYVKPYLRSVLLCLLLVGVITVLEIYKPVLIGNAIDRYITQDAAPEAERYTPDETLSPEAQAAAEKANQDARFAGILGSAGLYLLLLAILFVVNRAQRLLIEKTGQSIIYDIRMQVFEHVEKLTLRFFDTTPVGKIVTRVTNDVESVNELYANIMVNLFKNVAKIIGLAVIMLCLNVRMALYSFIMVPAVAVTTWIFRTLAHKAWQLSTSRRTAVNTFLSENISGMKVIQLFCREKEKHAEFTKHSTDYYKAGLRELMVNAFFRPGIWLMYVIATAILLIGGSASVTEGSLTLGTLYIFISYIDSFFHPIQELADQLSTLESAIASAEKIFTLLDIKPDFTDAEDPVKPDRVTGRIEFDHVWFAYKGEEWVLRDVSFTIEPGKHVAFVGATGAGKSSILNLIGRYYDVQKGSIRVDGVDIRQLDRETLRRAIGQVQQDVFLFTGDIAGNIRLRDDTITDEQIRAAAEHVNASRFIDRLPDGYSHPVSERGATLSAGQRQLLSFARTLAYDPSILILDEATANIDTETEQWIQEAMNRLMQGRTTIMVAHRLSTIQHADQIMVMHKGKIREQGTHQELLAQDGIYRKLYRLQLQDQQSA